MFLRVSLALCLGVAALVCGSTLQAQERPSDFPRDLPSALPEVLPSGPIVRVVIEPPLHGEDPLAVTGVTLHEPLTLERARRALRTALDTGTFAEARLSAQTTDGGIELILRGERRYILRDISVVGPQARPLDEVRRDLTLRAGSHVTDSDVAEARARLQRVYHEMGFDEALVESFFRETDTPAERVLILRVTEGEPTRVDRVDVSDVPAALRDAVRAELGVRAGDVADPRRLQQVNDRVLPVLRRAGYLGAEGLHVEFVDAAPHRQTLAVRVTPGDLHRVRWEGVTRVLERDLQDALRLDEERDVASPTLSVLAGRVRTYYLRRAYPDVRVRMQVEQESEGHRALVIRVDEGAQVLVGTMTFEGAHQLTEDALRSDVQGLLVSELPGGTAFTAPGAAVDAILNGEDRSDVPHDRPGPRLQLYPERTFVPELYTEAARRIVLRYRELGYLDTEVGAPTVTRVRDPDGVSRFHVVFHVVEGPRTLLDEAIFEGNHELASAALAEAAALTLGLPMDYHAIEEARVRVNDLYRERAFAFVRVEPEVLRSPDRTRARVRFAIHEGPRVRVGGVRVEGAVRTAEPLIRQRLALQEGGFYLLSTVRVSQRRLDQLGVFSGVNITLDDPDIEAPIKTVVVQVTERRPQAFEARFGYSLGQGVRLGFEYSYLNIFGAAVSLTLRAEVGYFIEIPGLTPVFPGNVRPEGIELLQYRVTPSLNFPYVPLLGPDFAASLDLAAESRLTTDSLFYTYSLVTRGVALSLVNRTVRNLTLTLTPEVQQATARLYGADTIRAFIESLQTQCNSLMGSDADRCRLRLATLQQQLRFPDGDNVLGSVRLGAAYDRRDSQFNPTRGVYLSLSTAILRYLLRPDTASGPAPTTLHLEGRATFYAQLPVLRIVFASSLRAGMNVQLATPGETHPLWQFLLGGADSMRGWLQNSMVPEDVAQAVATNPSSAESIALLSTLGGDAFVNWRNELRVPTGLCFAESLCLGIGVFLDAGNLWRLPKNVDLTQIRFSPGFGARFNTPFGVISFDFGFNTAPRSYIREQSYALQFSLGVF